MIKLHIMHPAGFILCREFEKSAGEPWPNGHGAVSPAEKVKASCAACIAIADDYFKQAKRSQ